MNERFTDFYMDIAYRTAHMSRAKRLQVGSVLVKDDSIISYGWNGTPAGWDNNCEDKEWCTGGGWLSPDEIEEGWPYESTYIDATGNTMQGRYRLKTRPEVLHSEANCLMKVAKSNNSTEGAALFVTHSPCIECAKLIYQSGINRVYFGNAYRDRNGIDFLTKAGVKVTKLDVDSGPTT